MDFEVGRLAWNIQLSPKHNCKCPNVVKQREVCLQMKDNVTTEAKIGVMQPQLKECHLPTEAGRGQDRILP